MEETIVEAIGKLLESHEANSLELMFQPSHCAEPLVQRTHEVTAS
jgi:hypothetical protein